MDSDPVQATTTINPVFERLINNTHAVVRDTAAELNRAETNFYAQIEDLAKAHNKTAYTLENFMQTHEEGIWTPTWAGTPGNMRVENAVTRWVRSGYVVNISGHFAITREIATTTAIVLIGGLPFPAIGTLNALTPIAVSTADNMFFGFEDSTTLVARNRSGTNLNQTNLGTGTAVGNSSIIRFNLTYTISQ